MKLLILLLTIIQIHGYKTIENGVQVNSYEFTIPPMNISYSDLINEINYTINFIKLVDNITAIDSLDMQLFFNNKNYRDKEGFSKKNYVTLKDVKNNKLKNLFPDETHEMSFIYPSEPFNEEHYSIKKNDTFNINKKLLYPRNVYFIRNQLFGKPISSIIFNFDDKDGVIRIEGSSKEAVQSLAIVLNSRFDKYNNTSVLSFAILFVILLLITSFYLNIGKKPGTLKVNSFTVRYETFIILFVVIILDVIIELITMLNKYKFYLNEQNFFEKNITHIELLLSLIISILSPKLYKFFKSFFEDIKKKNERIHDIDVNDT